MIEHEDRRKDSRKLLSEKILIQIVSTSKDQSLAGKTVPCTTRDVSANGMQIQLNQPVVEGCVLELWIASIGTKEKFYLTGNVMWSKAGETENSYLIGIQLQNDPASDLAAWQKHFA